MLAFCSLLLPSYYAKNYAGKIGASLTIWYNEMNTDDTYSKLLIENYQIPSVTKRTHFQTIVTIELRQYSYKVELEFYNVKFAALNNITNLFKITQLSNIFGSLIHFNQCVFEKFNPKVSN